MFSEDTEMEGQEFTINRGIPTMVDVDGSDAKVAILGYIVNTDLPIY